MEMKKIDLRLKQETVESIQELADKKYYGNRSLCARDLIEKSLDIPSKDDMNDFLIELKYAIELGKYIDYGYDGEDEYQIEAFDSDIALNNVVSLLKKLGLLKDEN